MTQSAELDDIGIVLDDQDGMALFDQGVEGGQQFADIMEVKSGGRLIENKQDMSLGAAFSKEGGEFDALGFAAGEGIRGLAQFDIARGPRR